MVVYPNKYQTFQTMRPFRFIFMLALGFLLFSFAGRFLFFAFIAAAVFGIFFFIRRKASRYFSTGVRKPIWKNDLLVDYPGGLSKESLVERKIEVL